MSALHTFAHHDTPLPIEFEARQSNLNGFTLVQTSERTRAGIEALTLALSSRYGEMITTYGKVYEVYDRAPKSLRGTPISQTHLPIDFHTDSSQKLTKPDVVGLACIQHAKGGETVLADVQRAYTHLEHHHRWTLRLLEQSFARAIVTPGEPRSLAQIENNSFPIFSRSQDGRIELRYMRSWIEEGARLLGNPLDELTLTALDHLDQALHRSVVYRRHLRPGDILFFNNRRLAHARLPYRDFAGKKRLLLRVWVDASLHETLCS